MRPKKEDIDAGPVIVAGSFLYCVVRFARCCQSFSIWENKGLVKFWRCALKFLMYSFYVTLFSTNALCIKTYYMLPNFFAVYMYWICLYFGQVIIVLESIRNWLTFWTLCFDEIKYALKQKIFVHQNTKNLCSLKWEELMFFTLQI